MDNGEQFVGDGYKFMSKDERFIGEEHKFISDDYKFMSSEERFIGEE